MTIYGGSTALGNSSRGRGKEKRARRKHKNTWVHKINVKRKTFGEFPHLFPDLLRDREKFIKYFRMSQEKFYKILENVKE